MKITQKLESSVQKKESTRPLDINGDVSTRRNGRLHKHCRDCTVLILADRSKLEKHYGGHHPGQKARFLSWSDPIEHTVYTNFSTYLDDHNTNLIKKAEEEKKLKRRPCHVIAPVQQRRPQR